MSGTLQDHPGRYKDRANEPTNLDELGRAPTYMSDEEKKIWKELAGNVTPGWLTRADRHTVELTVTLIAELRARTIDKPGRTSLTALLSKLGMNPCDRTKVQVPQKPKQDNDPWADYPSATDEPEEKVQ
jgi:phage terminase small subunit